MKGNEMKTKVIVITHGSSALPLCRTAQMIVGEQDNYEAVEFLPGENVDSLVAKITSILGNECSTSNVLFLVDVFGGSPFNAAMLIAAQHENYDVVSGVNIPMLVNFFIERDEDATFIELVDIVKQAGNEGIKRMKTDISFTTGHEEL